MLECIESTGNYYSSGDDERDDRTLDAILRRLQVLTESSKRVSEELKAANPHVSWREPAAFRNVVVHDYLGLRTERIWSIVRDDIPKLKAQLESMMREQRLPMKSGDL